MGEIGIPRRDFLYDIRFWEARRIIRGYRNRDKLKLQMMAECVFASMFSNRDPKGKTVQDMFPMLFDDDDEEEPTASISDEDREDLLDLMHSLNNNKKEC